RSKRDWSSDVCSSDLPLNVLPGYLFQHDIRSLPENREQHQQVHPPASAYKMPNAKCPDNIAEEAEQQLLLGYVLLKKEKPTSGRSEERRVGKECSARG